MFGVLVVGEHTGYLGMCCGFQSPLEEDSLVITNSFFRKDLSSENNCLLCQNKEIFSYKEIELELVFFVFYAFYVFYIFLVFIVFFYFYPMVALLNMLMKNTNMYLLK